MYVLDSTVRGIILGLFCFVVLCEVKSEREFAGAGDTSPQLHAAFP